MQSKSKSKLNNNFSQLSAKESFRAFIRAMNQDNKALMETIVRELPKDKHKDADKYLNLYGQKVNLYGWYLLIKALQAVRFYNLLTFKLFDLGKVEEEPVDLNQEFKIQEELRSKIEKIDQEAEGVLDLEEFQPFLELDVLCHQWMKVAVKIDTGYAIRTPVADFEKEKIRLEQLYKNQYPKE